MFAGRYNYGTLTAGASLALFAAGSAVLSIVTEPVILAIFGEAFRQTGQILAPCFLIGGLILAPSGFIQIFVVRKQAWADPAPSALGGIAMLLAMPPAILSHGVEGRDRRLGRAAARRPRRGGPGAPRRGPVQALTRGTASPVRPRPAHLREADGSCCAHGPDNGRGESQIGYFRIDHITRI